MSDVHVTGFDHLVLRVRDVERSLAWYVDELGLTPERVDEWRRGEVLFPSVRIDATTIIDLLADASLDDASLRDDSADRSRGNVDHLCLVVDAVDLAAVVASGRFDVVGGPTRLYGAQGEGEGIYVRDPDGNVVELRHY